MVAPVASAAWKRVQSVVCVRMELGAYDRSGRRRPFGGGSVLVPADVVIPAVSQYSDLPFIRRDEVEITKWGTFVVDPDTQMTTMRGVFASGDVVPGAGGHHRHRRRKEGRLLDRPLSGRHGRAEQGNRSISPSSRMRRSWSSTSFPMKYLDRNPQAQLRRVAQGCHRLNAIAEAMRCLHCDRNNPEEARRHGAYHDKRPGLR